jgi:predicted nucleotidyltransferase
MAVAMTAIESLVQRIAETFNPDKVILFGSHAANRANLESDVDLLVILPFEGRGFTKSLEILRTVNPPFPIDLIVRRPDDTSRRYEQGDPLIRDALDHGVVMYERRR